MSEQAQRTLPEQLDYLEFTDRTEELVKAGRLDREAVRTLAAMADESRSQEEFLARLRTGGPRMMGATEYRYLVTTLVTPEGQRPDTWEESAVYVRAFGADPYATLTIERQQQMEQDRQLLAAPSYS
ncbi:MULTISPECIES: hypothetical protein [unclassified Leucobacter]|uniref:hypothetical protein n=1 Tax=unclassified Leucobacter TaxID=2621730 RepID=UPI003017616C